MATCPLKISGSNHATEKVGEHDCTKEQCAWFMRGRPPKEGVCVMVQLVMKVNEISHTLGTQGRKTFS